MPFTSDEITNINNSALENYIDKGKVWKQNIANKPLLKAFNDAAGSFSGGRDYVNIGVASGQGGGSVVGYTADDQVTYYNPVGTKRAKYQWREHHIGMVVTHTELKIDGIEITESGADQSTSQIDGREEHALANILDEKMDALGEDFSYSMDLLLHQDGTSDAKAVAGIQALILDNPATGTTGTIGRVANTWWRNRAATSAYSAVQDAITSSTSNGGALIEFLEKEWLQLGKYRQGSTRWKIFAGSDIIAAYKKEMRANGYYSQDGFRGTQDGSFGDITWKGIPVEYDPTLDAQSRSKYMYIIDMGRTGIRLLYRNGKRMRKHTPARPYDRYVMYNGITTDCVLVAKQLNTSAVYAIA